MNTVFFTVLFIAMCLGVGIGLAILLDQKVKGEGTLRTIFLFPMALSFVVTGVVWKWLFNPTYGINQLPTYFGLPPAQFRWFISEEKVLVFNWQNLPYHHRHHRARFRHLLRHARLGQTSFNGGRIAHGAGAAADGMDHLRRPVEPERPADS